MSKKPKKKASIFKTVTRVNQVSVIVVGLYMVVTALILITSRTKADYILVAQSSCSSIESCLDNFYPGDYRYDDATQKLYKGEHEITDEFFNEIHQDNNDMQHTIFWGNTRVLTDILNEDGTPATGTQLTDETILSAVENEGIYAQSNVTLLGSRYSVCYLPLHNGDQIVGMLFCGVNQVAANRMINQAAGICIILTFILAFLIGWISTKIITKRSVDFGVNLNEASGIAEDKKTTVTELGQITVKNMDQINIAIDEITMAVSSQANHTEEIMGSMETFGNSIDSITSHVRNTANVSESSQQIIDEMKSQLDMLAQVSEENSQEIASISKQIQDDVNAVNDIRKVIDVINDIAFQITILSFNASVEAARAGEAGKGFAVVAGSIKELSDKTKASLEEITVIVEEINTKMVETNEASDHLITKNGRVVSALSDTKARMDSVDEAFAQISENISDVSTETDALVESKNQVVETVSSLAAMSEENAAMAEEIKATSDEVINATHGLLDEIDRLQEVTQIISEVKLLFNEKLK